MNSKPIRCFMDGIAWQHEIDATDVTLFPSVKSLREKALCLDGGCGIVEVEVRLIRWVEKQDLNRHRDCVHDMQPDKRFKGMKVCTKCGSGFISAKDLKQQ